MMVAPGIAIVVSSPYVTILDTWKLFITVLGEYNKMWGMMRVAEGAYYSARLVLSKYIMNKDTIKIHARKPKKGSKVVWQQIINTLHMRMQGTPIRQWPTMWLRWLSPATAPPDQPRDGTNDMLDTVSPYLVLLTRGKLNIDCTLEWLHTNQLFTWRWRTNQETVAKYLSTTLLDFLVSLSDPVATRTSLVSFTCWPFARCNHTFRQFMTS
jgi:hypothetical protein